MLDNRCTVVSSPRSRSDFLRSVASSFAKLRVGDAGAAQKVKSLPCMALTRKPQGVLLRSPYLAKEVVSTPLALFVRALYT